MGTSNRNFTLFLSMVGLCVLSVLPVHADKVKDSFTIKGEITEKGKGPVEFAYIVFNNAVSTLSDQDGHFLIKNVKPGEYDYYISCLGYEEVRGRYKVGMGDNVLKVVLKPAVLALKEVTVTAEQRALGSQSKIGQDAIRHIQAKSIEDMLQLLPGGLTKNPTLNVAAQANLREIDGNRNNALGAAVVVDGMPLSNDANMQVMSPSKSGYRICNMENGMDNQTTAGRGVDLRTVGTENIESIEVIRGIPSAEYGNLTSGVVIVKTKSGKTPLEVKFKADPFSKQVYAGKGFKLNHGGAINFGVDWSQSFADTRKRYMGYERVNASVGYSKLFGAEGAHPTTFNVRGAYYANIHTRKQDPQMEELLQNFSNENMGGRLAIDGKVQMNNWITALDYNVSAEVSHSLDKMHNWVANPDGIITNSMVDGLHQAYFKTKAYYSDYRVEGTPINVYARVKANRYIQFNDNDFTNFKLGVDYRLDGNRGKGLLFDMSNPPQAGGEQSLRPRSYREIPMLHNLSGFLENHTTVKIGTTQLQTVVGVRLSNLFLNKEKSGRNGIFVAEPRANVAYTILNKDNNPWIDQLSVNAGYGISNKMPTLLYLYPDNAYFDNHSLNYIGKDMDRSLALMTTKVVDHTQNPDLKPMTSHKWEVGMNFKVGPVKGFVTYFNERYYNEFGMKGQLEWLHYKYFDVPRGIDAISFKDGEVHYTLNGEEHVASGKDHVEMDTWNRAENTSRTYKQGIEYTLDLGTIPYIKTSLNMDGAWFRIRRQQMKESLNYKDRREEYVGIMPAGSGSLRSRVNTNFRLITHIPEVKMVFTTTLQVVWNETDRSIYEDANGQPVYQLAADGKSYQVMPLGFYDRTGTYTTWLPEHAQQYKYDRMINEYKLYAFNSDWVKPWVLLNFRFTKELGEVADLSFTVNNFPNVSRWHVDRNTHGKHQLYPSMYFGAELKFKL